MGRPLVIALLSVCRISAISIGIIPAIAESASSDTVLYTFVKKRRKDLCICSNLCFFRFDILLYHASSAYVIVGKMAYLYIIIIINFAYDTPHVALEQRARLLRMCSILFSRYWVWGNQSILLSIVIPKYYIFFLRRLVPMNLWQCGVCRCHCL